MSDADAAGSIVHGDVGDPQGSDFADPQAGLEYQLHHRIVTRRQPVGGSAGGAQNGVNLDIGQANRLQITHSAHRPDPVRDVRRQGAGPARPSAQSAQRFQPAVNRGRPPTGGDHVLPIGDQVMLSEILDDEGPVLDRTAPGDEMAKIVAVTSHGCRREIVPLQTEQEGRHPFRLG